MKLTLTELLNLLVRKDQRRIRIHLQRLPINKLEEFAKILQLMTRTSIIAEALGMVKGELYLRKHSVAKQLAKEPK